VTEQPTGDRAALVEALARRFHDTYERLAPDHGWQTQESTRAKPWEEVPEHNRQLMLATIEALLDDGSIEVGSGLLAGFPTSVADRWGCPPCRSGVGNAARPRATSTGRPRWGPSNTRRPAQPSCGAPSPTGTRCGGQARTKSCGSRPRRAASRAGTRLDSPRRCRRGMADESPRCSSAPTPRPTVRRGRDADVMPARGVVLGRSRSVDPHTSPRLARPPAGRRQCRGRRRCRQAHLRLPVHRPDAGVHPTFAAAPCPSHQDD